MATNSLGQLTLDLVARTQGFVQGMDKAERRTAKWRRQVQKQLRGLQGDFAKFAKMAAAGGVAAAGAFTIMAKEGLAYVDAQAKMARQIGASIDGLRALQIAGEDAGVATDTLNGAVDRMNARLGEARQGSGQAYEALNKLGLSADSLARMDADQRIAAIADRVQELGLDSADTADLLRDLGIRNREMVNLLMQGGDAIRAARVEVDEYGLSLSEVDAAKVEAANDAFARIPRMLEPIKNQIAIALADPMQDVAQRFNDAARETNGFEMAVVDAMGTGLDWVGRFTEELNGVYLLLLKVQRFQYGVEAFAEQNRLNPTQGYGRMSNYGLDNPPPETGPATERYEQVDELIREIEEGGGILNGVNEELARIRDGIAERRQEILDRNNGVFDLGGDDEGWVSTAAIDAANQVAGTMDRLAEATGGVIETEEDKNDETETTTRAVRELGAASHTAARAMAGMGNWGKGALGTIAGMVPEQDNGMLSVRQRIEASKDLSAYWLEPNPSAKPTWSTGYADPEYLNTAAQVSGYNTFSSVAGQAASELQAAPAAKNMGHITLSLKTDQGETEAEGEISKTLVDLLTGAAAAASSR